MIQKLRKTCTVTNRLKITAGAEMFTLCKKVFLKMKRSGQQEKCKHGEIETLEE